MQKDKLYLLIASITICLFVYPIKSYSGEALTEFSTLNNAGLLLVDDQGKAVITTDANKAFIPASTTKLITAWLALNQWGEGHQFQTQFYLDTSKNILWVKGSGDPFLVSEELDLIASNLAQLGIQQLNAIGLDVSLFQSDLIMPGTDNSSNPYDAISTALAGNFNTIAIKKVKGEIFSAEAQTPLTAFAISIANRFKAKNFRVNTGLKPRDSERYFAELLAAMLRNQGVLVKDEIIWGTIPKQRPIYTHVNSKPLADIIRSMLKYSTNFVANQLVLMGSAETYQRPANFNDVQLYMEEQLVKHFKWQDFTMKDGAGLSRENQLSPKQLVELLEALKPWRHLLPEIEPGVYAKTGTLKKVRTLAGYVVDSQQRLKTFALMMNQAVSYRLRNRIAHELIER